MTGRNEHRRAASIRAAATLLALTALTTGCSPAAREAGPYDVLITNARVVDGAGNPWFRADVGIRGDRIAAVGALAGQPARRTIDAADRVVTPGFIDMMGQSTVVLVTDPPSAESKLRQGITTYLSGEGGSACAAASPDADPVRLVERRGASLDDLCGVLRHPRVPRDPDQRRPRRRPHPGATGGARRPGRSTQAAEQLDADEGSSCARRWRTARSARRRPSSTRPRSTRAPKSSSS